MLLLLQQLPSSLLLRGAGGQREAQEGATESGHWKSEARVPLQTKGRDGVGGISLGYDVRVGGGFFVLWLIQTLFVVKYPSVNPGQST